MSNYLLKPASRLLLTFSALALATVNLACSTITTQVEGWPQDLTVRVQNTGLAQIQEKCYASIPLPYKLLGGFATECAVIDLDGKTCDIYTIWQEASKHELNHCRGGDHDGLLQAYFDRWKCLRVKLTDSGCLKPQRLANLEGVAPTH